MKLHSINIAPIGRIRIRVTDANGKNIFDETRGMHSYTINFLHHWLRVATAEETAGLTEVNDTTFTMDDSYWNAGVGHVRGVVVGSGTTASDFNDTKLETVIDHGTSAGELEYGDQSETTNETDGEYDVEVSRTFSNNSGGNVTVNEIGIYGSTNATASATTNMHMLLREVLGSGITIPDAGSMTVDITHNYNTDAASVISGSFAMMMAGRYGSSVNYNGVPNVEAGTIPNSGYRTTRVNAGVDEPRGIVVGTSASPFDKDPDTQPTLVAIIDNGSGSGELEWTNTSIDEPTSDAASGSFTLRKTFVNDSGGDITIAEVGLYGFINNDVDDDTDTLMLTRSVLSSTITLSDGEGVEIVLTFEVNHNGSY